MSFDVSPYPHVATVVTLPNLTNSQKGVVGGDLDAMLDSRLRGFHAQGSKACWKQDATWGVAWSPA
jgi:hypothetical protein